MEPMLWEKLVTDGHVRAARLRHLAPFFIVASILLIGAGCYILARTSSEEPFYSNSDSLLRQWTAEFQQPVLNNFSQASNIYVPYTELKQLVPEDELPQVYRAVRDSLNKTGGLPTDLDVKKAESPAAFWSWDWPHNELIYLDRGDLRAFGAIVLSKAGTANQQQNPHPVRWLAIFRRATSGWDDVAIKGNMFTAPPEEKTAVPADLSLTLRKLMDVPDQKPTNPQDEELLR